MVTQKLSSMLVRTKIAFECSVSFAWIPNSSAHLLQMYYQLVQQSLMGVEN